MEAKIASLSREKLESLSISAVERVKKDTLTVQELTRELEELRANDALLESRLQSIEQECDDLTRRKHLAEEEIKCLQKTLEKEEEEEVEDPENSQPKVVEEQLVALEAEVAAKLELAKEKVQEFKNAEDAKLAATKSRLEELREEVARGETLAALVADKASLGHLPTETVVLEESEDNALEYEQLGTELMESISRIQNVQSEIFDAVDAHQRMLHARSEERSFLQKKLAECEEEQKTLQTLALEEEKYQDELSRLQSSLDDEKERELSLRTEIEEVEKEKAEILKEIAIQEKEAEAKEEEGRREEEDFREEEERRAALLKEQEDRWQQAQSLAQEAEQNVDQKIAETKTKADERFSLLEKKIGRLRKEAEEIQCKLDEKEAAQATAEETVRKYTHVMQQANAKITEHEESAQKRMEELKELQEELRTAQARWKEEGSEEVAVVEEGAQVWVFNGSSWRATTAQSPSIQSTAEKRHKHCEHDLELVSHQVEHLRRTRERVEQEFEAYKERAQLAEETKVQQHRDLVQVENSVEELERLLKECLVAVKKEQDEVSAINPKLRERRAALGEAHERRLESDVECRSLEGQLKMLLEQQRMMEKMGEKARRDMEEKKNARFQKQLRALELDLNLQRNLLPKLKTALEEVENVEEVMEYAVPIQEDGDRVPIPEDGDRWRYTICNDPGSTICPIPVEWEDAPTIAPYDSKSFEPEHTPDTSNGWKELMKHRDQLRACEEELREDTLRVKQITQEYESTNTALRTIKEKHTLETNLHEPLQMEYIRNIFTKYLEISATGTSEHEQLLRVVMTFFQFSPEEALAVDQKRQQKKPTGWFF